MGKKPERQNVQTTVSKGISVPESDLAGLELDAKRIRALAETLHHLEGRIYRLDAKRIRALAETLHLEGRIYRLENSVVPPRVRRRSAPAGQVARRIPPSPGAALELIDRRRSRALLGVTARPGSPGRSVADASFQNVWRQVAMIYRRREKDKRSWQLLRMYLDTLEAQRRREID
jgi:hypothetical protein